MLLIITLPIRTIITLIFIIISFLYFINFFRISFPVSIEMFFVLFSVSLIIRPPVYPQLFTSHILQLDSCIIYFTAISSFSFDAHTILYIIISYYTSFIYGD